MRNTLSELDKCRAAYVETILQQKQLISVLEIWDGESDQRVWLKSLPIDGAFPSVTVTIGNNTKAMS